jgi:hypothetical protein
MKSQLLQDIGENGGDGAARTVQARAPASAPERL